VHSQDPTSRQDQALGRLQHQGDQPRRRGHVLGQRQRHRSDAAAAAADDDDDDDACLGDIDLGIRIRIIIIIDIFKVTYKQFKLLTRTTV